jgi:cell division protease FtsH
MGGRVAEELAIGRITTGASNDLQVATGIARSIVTEYGMSSKLAPRAFGQRFTGFLGMQDGAKDYSEATAQRIDQEIDTLLTEAYTYVKDLLTKQRPLLDAITVGLREKETLTAEDLAAIQQKLVAVVTPPVTPA